MLAELTPAWELTDFLGNAAKYVRQVMGWIGIILGAVGLVWGFAVIIKGLMGGNGQPVPWMKGFALILVGGVMAWGTWRSLYRNVGKGMNQTVNNMGDGRSTTAAKPDFTLASQAKLPKSIVLPSAK